VGEGTRLFRRDACHKKRRVRKKKNNKKVGEERNSKWQMVGQGKKNVSVYTVDERGGESRTEW